MNCSKDKNCKASTHWKECPHSPPARMNDDATYNRSNLTVEGAMAIGMWDLVPQGRGDSMG